MKKKLQIFVSSTYKDLKDERQAAVEAILEAGHIPAGMELFAAGDKSQLETIKKWIDASDIFMLILGGRYGSIEPETNLSYIEVEYNYASENDKPLFAIVINESEIKKRKQKYGKEFFKIENQDKLKKFREFVLSKTSSFFSDTKDVKLAIYKSINELLEEREFIGWVSGKYAKTEADLQKTNDMHEYIGKLEKELNELKKISAKNTSDLAQGNDIIDLDFTIQDFSLKEKITWDQLFLVIARKCLKGDSQNLEKNIKIAVVDFIGAKIGLNNRMAILKDKSFVKSFEKIKIQFIALDLIDISTQPYTSTSKYEAFWNLTAKGKRHFTDLLAIKKK